MVTRDSVLFKPIRIGSLELKNRFIMPAMNSHGTENNHFTEEGAAYYAERAKGGFAVCITEFMAVDPYGMGSLRSPGIWDDTFLESLKMFTDAIHKEHGLVFAQLVHAGDKSKSIKQDYVKKAVSAYTENGVTVPELTAEEIKDITDRFIKAAKRAKKAGFDGVEVHGAHGYLLTQMMNRRINHRLDEYGGGYDNRFRMAREILQRVKRECGEDFPVSFRINAQDGQDVCDGTVDDNVIFAKMAQEAGADMIHVSTGYNGIASYYYPPAWNAHNVKRFKEVLDIPVVCVGRINDENVAETVVENGVSDLVSLGRQSLCDPYFPEKLYSGNAGLIFHCLACMQRCNPMTGCEAGDELVSCMLNPFTGKETRWKLTRTNDAKRIMVIGAGCSGMETAWILAARGHQVTLYEKGRKPGGNLLAAAVPPHKSGFLQVIRTLQEHCRIFGVKEVWNHEVTQEELEQTDADVVIITTGSIPLRPPVMGLEQAILADEVLRSGQILKQKKTVVIGGGSVGLETAEYLLQYGNQVDVIELKETIAADMNPNIRADLLSRLKGKVQVYTETMLMDMKDGYLHVRQREEEKTLGRYDAIISAMGYRNYQPFHTERISAQVYVAGDAVKARDIKMAVYEAAKLGLQI